MKGTELLYNIRQKEHYHYDHYPFRSERIGSMESGRYPVCLKVFRHQDPGISDAWPGEKKYPAYADIGSIFRKTNDLELFIR